SEAAFTPSAYKTFAEWKAACDRLPFNRQLRRGVAPKELLPIKSFKEFNEVVEGFYGECKNGTLSRTNLWVGDLPSRAAFFNTDKVYFQKAIPFQPFAQKLVVPSGSEILFHGDLHGDVHSLVAWLDWLNKNKYLEDFKLTRPNLYVVMLGDYTDRGTYGIEVLYTLLRLKLANPDRVCLIRGNHEDVTLAMNYGFLAEIQAKYGREFNVTKVLRGYDFLPVVLYLGFGDDFIQCNHGGMEPGFDPRSLLEAEGPIRFQFLGRLNQARFLKENPKWSARMDAGSRRIAEDQLKDFKPEDPVRPSTVGFMWNDFSVAPGEPALGYDPGRAFIYGESSTEYILKAASRTNRQIRAVFRAHQHSSLPNPLMRRLKVSRGLFRHWQPQDSVNLLAAAEPKLQNVLDRAESRPIPPNSVWTFNVAPDTVYGEGCTFDFDTSAILTVGEKFEDWRLRVINLPVMK
ncbi:MAG: metallophosphoesterase, partial [Verrucomicrobiales bacterium]|nr:metallophosphoesterase [Verrucomicrobiales bacterium]